MSATKCSYCGELHQPLAGEGVAALSYANLPIPSPERHAALEELARCVTDWRNAFDRDVYTSDIEAALAKLEQTR